MIEVVRQLIITRHGQTDANAQGRTIAVTDPDLNDNGRSQAARLGRALSRENIDLVISSPRIRCVTTAEAVVQGQGIPPEFRTDERLVELGMGAIEGLSHAELQRDGLGATFRQWRQGTPPAYPDGAETFDAAASRLDEFFQEVIDVRADRVLLVGHSHALRILLASSVLRGAPESHRRLFLDHATITTVFWEDGQPRLGLLNCAPDAP